LFLLTGRSAEAFALGEVALLAHDSILGSSNHWTLDSVRLTAQALHGLDRPREAAELLERFGLEAPSECPD
jgi:hypothetical protein